MKRSALRKLLAATLVPSLLVQDLGAAMIPMAGPAGLPSAARMLPPAFPAPRTAPPAAPRPRRSFSLPRPRFSGLFAPVRAAARAYLTVLSLGSRLGRDLLLRAPSARAGWAAARAWILETRAQMLGALDVRKALPFPIEDTAEPQAAPAPIQGAAPRSDAAIEPAESRSPWLGAREAAPRADLETPSLPAPSSLMKPRRLGPLGSVPRLRRISSAFIHSVAEAGPTRGGFQTMRLRGGDSEVRSSARLEAGAAPRPRTEAQPRPQATSSLGQGFLSAAVAANARSRRSFSPDSATATSVYNAAPKYYQAINATYPSNEIGAGAVAGGSQYVLADGTKISTTYDGSQPYGQRTRWALDAPNGAHQEFMSSPLIFDLDGRGLGTSERRIAIDIDGDGKLDSVNDLRRGVGLLVFDADGDGVSGRDAREFFGDGTDVDGDGNRDRFPDGFAALAAFARRAVRDGVLPTDTLEKGELGPKALRALEKTYGLRMRLGGFRGRTVTLAEAGVTRIALSQADVAATPDFDGRGNALARQEGARFVRMDGSSGVYADLWLRRGEVPASVDVALASPN
ncbi:MAG TPA: hypothetical protein VNI01_01950 [Elusimicrobiota bacterium]|nr:hypothetical protein [Elusimicrobiota bacterium]